MPKSFPECIRAFKWSLFIHGVTFQDVSWSLSPQTALSPVCKDFDTNTVTAGLTIEVARYTRQRNDSEPRETEWYDERLYHATQKRKQFKIYEFFASEISIK